MKKFTCMCDVVGLLGVSVFMLLASLALSASRLMAVLALSILMRFPAMLLNPALNARWSPLIVIQKGNKTWITCKFFRLTFAIGLEKMAENVVIPHATDNVEEYERQA